MRCLLVFLLLTVAVAAEPSYRGHIHIEEGAPLQTLVLSNDEELANFQKRLPKFRVSKKQPAPPSDDPLLKLKTLAHPLAVIVRPANLSFHPELVRLRLRKGTLEVHYRLPEEQAEARVYGMGTYTAVELKEPFTSVTFIEK